MRKLMTTAAALVPLALSGVLSAPASAYHDPAGACTDPSLRATAAAAGLCHLTEAGDFAGQNGPGSLAVYAPDGRVFGGFLGSGCCTTASIPAGVIADGQWRIESHVSCCGGMPRYAWTIAGWVVPTTPFLCWDGASATLYLDYDSRTWTHTCN